MNDGLLITLNIHCRCELFYKWVGWM